MNEKRFKYYAFDGFEDNGKQMSSYEVEETLNKFQELSIKDLKKIEQLEKENKELKRDRNYWKTLAQSLSKNNGNVKLKDEHLAWKRVDVE